MKKMSTGLRVVGILSLVVHLLLLISCTAPGPSSFKDGHEFFDAADYDNAVIAYSEAANSDPGNPEYKMRLDFARSRAAAQHKYRGDELQSEGKYNEALKEYIIAARLDPSIETSQSGVQTAKAHVDAQNLVNEGIAFFQKRRFKQAKKAADLSLQLVPDFQPALNLLDKINASFPTIIDGVVLEVGSTEPITLNFTKVKIPDAFKIITDLSGINFIIDEDIRSKTTTLYLEKATFAQALELMLSMNKLDKKILNSKTIILFPKNKEKQKQFEDQVIQTFYLSNIDAKKAVNLLRTILQLRKVYVHEELNAVVLRDTPSVVKLAEKILEANDRATSEVVFDLELIEVSHANNLALGPELSNYGFAVGIEDPNNPGTIGPVVVENLDGLNFLYGLPSATFDLLKQNGDGQVLASPKIRVKNKEKAKVHIGSREPVVTVTINDTQTSENVQYIDVGVKLDVEPTIQLDDTVVTKLGLEVSNVTGRDETSNGTAVLTIATTNATTSLTLKNGVRTVLGGLLRTAETTSTNTIPILGDIPLLGKLFTSYSKEVAKREILLSITPHIVKSVNLPGRDVTSLWSGGEDDLKNGRNFGSFAEEYQGGKSGRSTSPVPATNPRKVIDIRLLEEEDESIAIGDENISAESVSPLSEPVESTAAGISPPVPELLPDLQGQVRLIGANKINKGAEVEVYVVAEEVRDLFSAPMTIHYDSNLLDFVSATEGAFMKKGGETVFTSSAMPEKGLVIVGVKQAKQGSGVSGRGALFRLVFKAKAVGAVQVNPVQVNFRNPQGEPIKMNASGLALEVLQ